MPLLAALSLLPLALHLRREHQEKPGHKCEEQARVRIEDTGAYGCPCLTLAVQVPV